MSDDSVPTRFGAIELRNGPLREQEQFRRSLWREFLHRGGDADFLPELIIPDGGTRERAEQLLAENIEILQALVDSLPPQAADPSLSPRVGHDAPAYNISINLVDEQQGLPAAAAAAHHNVVVPDEDQESAVSSRYRRPNAAAAAAVPDEDQESAVSSSAAAAAPAPASDSARTVQYDQFSVRPGVRYAMGLYLLVTTAIMDGIRRLDELLAELRRSRGNARNRELRLIKRRNSTLTQRVVFLDVDIHGPTVDLNRYAENGNENTVLTEINNRADWYNSQIELASSVARPDGGRRGGRAPPQPVRYGAAVTDEDQDNAAAAAMDTESDSDDDDQDVPSTSSSSEPPAAAASASSAAPPAPLSPAPQEGGAMCAICTDQLALGQYVQCSGPDRHALCQPCHQQHFINCARDGSLANKVQKGTRVSDVWQFPCCAFTSGCPDGNMPYRHRLGEDAYLDAYCKAQRSDATTQYAADLARMPVDNNRIGKYVAKALEFAQTSRCPFCRFPQSKRDECNHMTCANKNCRPREVERRFCYVCEESMIAGRKCECHMYLPRVGNRYNYIPDFHVRRSIWYLGKLAGLVGNDALQRFFEQNPTALQGVVEGHYDNVTGRTEAPLSIDRTRVTPDAEYPAVFCELLPTYAPDRQARIRRNLRARLDIMYRDFVSELVRI